MRLVLKQSFHDFFYMRQRNNADMDLLYRMQALNRETVCNKILQGIISNVLLIGRHI